MQEAEWLVATRKLDFRSDFDFPGKKENESVKLFTLQDSNAPEKILHELLFHSMVSRLIKRCHGSCGDMLIAAIKEDYLVVKSRGRVRWVWEKARWTQSAACCTSISRLKTLKINHGVRKMYTMKPSFSPKLYLKKRTCQITRGSESLPWINEWMFQIINSKVL